MECSGKGIRALASLKLQNTVPSLSISIGGPLVSDRLILAISRPPFHVAPSSTCARLSCSVVNPSFWRMSAARRSLVSVSYQVDTCWRGYNSQFYDSHSSPFYDGWMRGRNSRKSRLGVDREEALPKRKNTQIDQKAALRRRNEVSLTYKQ